MKLKEKRLNPEIDSAEGEFTVCTKPLQVPEELISKRFLEAKSTFYIWFEQLKELMTSPFDFYEIIIKFYVLGEYPCIIMRAPSLEKATEFICSFYEKLFNHYMSIQAP